MNSVDQINEAGKIAGSISAIIALAALVLFTPMKNYIKSRREQRKNLKADEASFRLEVRRALTSLNETLVLLTDDIADLQYERLSQAYEFYMGQGWCPGSKKELLCQMHKSYRQKGRNHLSEHYEEEILRLDSNPKMQKER